MVGHMVEDTTHNFGVGVSTVVVVLVAQPTLTKTTTVTKLRGLDINTGITSGEDLDGDMNG